MLRSWIPELRPLFAVTAVLFVVTAVIYPLAVTGIAQGVFPKQANGSIVEVDGQEVGSSLIGQQFTEPHYFHGRPSAAGDGYDAGASSGSNLGPTSDKLLNGVEDDPATTDVDESFAGIAQRVQQFREENGLPADAEVPADAVTASGSGLDPHVSPATARLQVARVAAARGADEAAIADLVEDHVEDPALGIIGEPRVSILKLNIALDEQFPLPE
ncbi:MAG: K(+)-transporting ATPase subunit C [Dehalococcoidia bacterium]|nr:K(+)-transporting ATPase subunit C [Dehalococcoidia bacterium]